MTDTNRKKIAAKSNIGKKRKNNEDAAFVASTAYGSLMIAADGMGGHRKGEVASKIVMDYLSIPFYSNRHAFHLHSVKNFYRKNLKKANKEIYHLATNDIDYKEMGTTIVSALIFEKGVYVVSVGDSRCYTFTKESGLKQITTDQSYVQFLFETGRIKKSEMASHPEKHLLTNAVGVNPQISNVEEFYLEEIPDAILLCTDGLYNLVSDEQIQKVILDEEKDAEEKAQALIDLALENGGTDNVAAVLWVK